MPTRPSLLQIAAISLVLTVAACSTERTFGARWELTTKGVCKGPGVDPLFAAEQEITLRFENRPNHYYVICSNKLAAKLKDGGRDTVPMVVRRNGGPGSSMSLCEVAGLKDNVAGVECTFRGLTSSGFENEGTPTPWD